MTRPCAPPRRTPRARRLAGPALLAGLVAVLAPVHAAVPPAAAAARTPARVTAAVPVPAVPAGLPSGVEDLQPYLGQIGCDPVAKPGVVRFQSLLVATYRDSGAGYIARDCATGGQSEHKEGRALDWGVSAGNPSHVAEVAALTDWLLAYRDGQYAAYARRFGIMYIIWNHQTWKAYQPEKGWQPYTGADPHTSHVHFSFGWNGAYGATSWWTGRVAPLDHGPYAATMPSPPRPPAPITNAIDAEHAALGGDTGLLGPATGPEVDAPGGRSRSYRSGLVLWSPATGAHEVHGDVLRRYAALGASASVLGLPVADERAVPGGRASAFAGGTILWSGATGAQAVHGAVGGAYAALGGPASPLGLPVREEADVAGGRGALFAGGRIDWSAATGAHEVHGALAQAYAALGAEGGLLGLPVGDERPAGPGRGSAFRGGDLLWSAATGAHEVHGAVRGAWLALGGPTSVLGLPTADEADEADRRGGRRGTFARGRVLWSAATGAHAVYGALLGRFLTDGGVGAYGFPVGDEHDAPYGRTQDLERAALDWDRTTGATTVRSR